VNGRFITFEGIDGAGKSTHIEPLASRLRAHGRRVVCTREPGGTPLAEQLRALLLHEQMDGVVETLLVFAARRDHLDRVIVPALARGDTVLCDRFTDATFAYQGAGRGQDERMLRDLEGWVHGALQPDLTLWFDVDPAIAASRRAKARVSDRFESEDAAFFARVRDGYARRMREAPTRFCRIDSALDKAAVERQIDDAVAALEERRR
jgi:dTMP kinase